MFTKFFYPIICTDKFKQTINFYEDFLGYVPEVEMDGFAILKREEFDNMNIAVIDRNHECIPDAYRRPVSGLMISYPVADARASYQDMYWEGLNLISEPEESSCGLLRFLLEDPNGVVIAVSEVVPAVTIEGRGSSHPSYEAERT